MMNRKEIQMNDRSKFDPNEGIVPCAICRKWVFVSGAPKDKSGDPVHPCCLNRECDFCSNPDKLPVGFHWDIESDEDKAMCEKCARKRKIADMPGWNKKKDRRIRNVRRR